jgi:glutamate racemase
VQRSLRIASQLIELGATALVVACNTATAAAVHSLRERWPSAPSSASSPG